MPSSEPIRVTEVLNYFKEPWYIDWVHRVGRTEANKIAKAAQKIGSRVDELIKSDSGLVPKDKDEVRNCMSAYKKWLEVYKPTSITPCTRLYATIEGQEVTGEPDIMVDDVLVDIKCSSKISLSYWVQVNMYLLLKYKQTPSILDIDCSNPDDVDKILRKFHGKKVGILRLDKVTASYEYVVQDYDANKVSVWCGLMRAFVYYKGVDDDGDGAEL